MPVIILDRKEPKYLMGKTWGAGRRGGGWRGQAEKL